MANSDPRLQWRQLQVSSPNVSGLMAQVRGGINDAASAAEGILGRYQEGAELKAENELIRRIGGMDQDQLRSAFNSGAFDDLNLGENGLRTLNEAMGVRANIRSTNVNSDRTQALIGWGNDANSRANAAEGRSATRFGWETDEYNRVQAQQEWIRNNARDFFDAERGALTGGRNVPQGDIQSAVYQGLIDRGMPEHIAQGFMMNFQDESGFKTDIEEKEANVHGTKGKGLYQLTGSRRQQFEAKYGNDYSIDNQLDFLMSELQTSERKAWDIIQNSKTAGEAGAHIVNSFLRPASEHAQSRTARYLNSGPNTFQRPRNQDIQTGFGGDVFTAAMAASGLFTPQEILGQVNPLREAGQRGDKLIRQQDAATTADLVTGITQNVVSSDGFIPGDAAGAQTAIQEQLLQTGEYSTSEAADLAAAAIANIEADAALNTEFNRGRSTEAQNAVINEALGNAMKQANRGLQGTDQYRALSDIPRYEENPAGSLEADLGIADDPQTPSNYRSEDLRRMVNDLAAHYKVPPAVMAVAMRDAYNADPGFIKGQDTWHGLGWDLTRNSLENRFDRAAVEAAVAQLTPERQAEFDRAQSELTINETRLQQNASQQRQIISQMNRFEASGNTDDPRYQTLRERLDRLIQEAATISRADGNLDGR